jgi:site-specific DNA-methyltransferase (adenine-specific)
MGRVEHIGDATLYLGDCLEILPTLGKVDAVVTDPPYGIAQKFGVQHKLDGVRRLQFDWDSSAVNETVFAALRFAADMAPAIFTFCGTSQVSHIETLLSTAGFTVKPAVWIKACPPPAMPGNWWPSGFEYALYAYRSGAYFESDDTSRGNVFYSDTYRHGVRADEKVAHPTQKWLPLLRQIVEPMVARGATAVDPFMGSGTTGVACAKLGRRFIGIEIDPGYFEIACKRIDDAYRQRDLFRDTVPVEPKPIQPSLLGDAA